MASGFRLDAACERAAAFVPRVIGNDPGKALRGQPLPVPHQCRFPAKYGHKTGHPPGCVSVLAIALNPLGFLGPGATPNQEARQQAGGQYPQCAHPDEIAAPVKNCRRRDAPHHTKPRCCLGRRWLATSPSDGMPSPAARCRSSNPGIPIRSIESGGAIT